MTRVKYKQPCNTGGREEYTMKVSSSIFFLALIQNNLAPIQDAGANYSLSPPLPHENM